MKRICCISALAATLALLLAGPAAAKPGVGEARGFVPREVVVKFEGEATPSTVELPAGTGVRDATAALRGNDRVEYAAPNFIATTSALVPRDSGVLGAAAQVAAKPGGWSLRQWNFLPWRETSGAEGLPISPGGIDAPGAWANLIAAGRPGASGVTVAILDTGVAYRDRGSRFRRSPDFAAGQFVPGYDFVDDDRVPLDENGHGTHVAGTIGERTNNGTGLTGLAYRAKLMPVRVLDARGRGDAVAITNGIRFAVANGAQVINMSFNFGCGKQVPSVDEALRQAYARGVVVVASGGNLGAETCVSPPATGPRVIGVGGSTEGGCLGEYSLAGKAIDLLGPGGGVPAPGCASISARPIYQVTLRPGSTSTFTIPNNYVGTSMAAAHVSGVAAMVLASGVLSKRLSAKALADSVRRRLTGTARDLGLPATQQGAGLLDAAAATKRSPAKVARAARVATKTR